MKIELELSDIPVEKLAAAFVALCSDQQAEFFAQVVDQAEAWPNHQDTQWCYMAMDATPRQRNAIRQVSTFVWKFLEYWGRADWD